MQTDFNSTKSIVWFVDEFNSQLAAKHCLNDYDAKMENTYFGKVSYMVGNLKRKGKDNIKIYLLPLGDTNRDPRLLCKPMLKIIGNANKIFLSGTCSGRPGSVRLGDIILVSSCYHIDRGSSHDKDGNVHYDSRPVRVSETAMVQLKNLEKTKIDVGACPSTLKIRCGNVLNHLKKAGKSLPLTEFYKIGTDVNADRSTRRKQWTNCIKWLQEENSYITTNYDDSPMTMTITEKGKTYCKDNNLGTVDPKPEHPTIHIGETVTSNGIHANLKNTKSWEKFDTLSLKIIGIERSAYDVLSVHPDTIVVQAVKNYADGVENSSINEYAYKTAAIAVRHFITEIE